MTAKVAARAMEFSEAKLFRMEAGEVPMRALEVERMCQIYGAPDDLTRAMTALARETKAKGWWQSFDDDLGPNFTAFVGLETAASESVVYQTELIDGLFQTEAYARAIVKACNPEAESLKAETVDQIARFRLERQKILTRPGAPLVFKAVLGEVALRRPIGGRKTMAEQLTRLVEVGRRPNVEIRVMPLEASEHRGVGTGQFAILRFPPYGNGRLAEPPIVHVEGFLGGLYLDKPYEVERYEVAWAEIWDAALDEQSSTAFIMNLRKELT